MHEKTDSLCWRVEDGNFYGQECTSMVEHWLSVDEVLDSVLKTVKQTNKIRFLQYVRKVNKVEEEKQCIKLRSVEQVRK